MNLVTPLEWPANIIRRRNRVDGKFTSEKASITVHGALNRLERELERHQAKDIEVSAYFGKTRGLNIARQWAGGDPGVCVRFDIGKVPYTLPCDTYTDLAQNIAAIAAHLGAVRAMERHGVATTAQTMGAFKSLPEPTVIRPWYDVLGVQPTATDGAVRAAYRDLAKMRHPDMPGGSHEAMTELTGAMESFMASKELAK